VTAALVASRASIRKHSKSFALASELLGSNLRDEAAAVYAFCRRADDAIDLVPAKDQGAALAGLEGELEAVYSGEALAEPVLAAFQDVVRRRSIPREYPAELLRGMAMDVSGAVYPDYDSLLVYCFRVAGTVGLMMSHVLGVRDPAALRHAAHLGMGMQLTNVCRDVREDWQRGRLYLPDSLLAEAAGGALRGRPDADLPRDAREPVSRVVRELLHRADDLYRSGDEGIPLLPWRAALAVRTARLVCSDIGRVILERGADPFAPRAFVSTGRKLWLALRATVRTAASFPPAFVPAPLPPALGFHDVISV
jgi:phytoene synthase